MQPERQTLARIAAKEITLFFSSPIAYLFLGTFAAVTLFVFFWGEAFFARNIADVRPMFEWMPLLLILLTNTLTMRLWSEERRHGTLEHVLTQPVPLWHFVVGKFLGCLALLAIALTITLPLPISVSLMGDLDWGPVVAGYLAAFLLGAAYLSIGLFVSARSHNQIVSLLSAVALSGAFYLVGSATMTELFSHSVADWLRLVGFGSRFESITRGVIDLRDLAYYSGVVLTFLSLNTFVLEKERWSHHQSSPRYSHWSTITALVVANVVGLNLWLGQVTSFRLDVTEGQQYSLSTTTERQLNDLQEPLLIRGYFSAKTHPLLAPLVPQLKDLITEFGLAGGQRVRVEFVDPADDPELEEEANKQFNIRPVPMQMADRYQASIVSAYFNVLIQYGDQHQVLGFQDLIEVKSQGEGDLEVGLKNPEYDLTRTVKKVVETYQAGGSLFDAIESPVTLTAYIDGQLPEALEEFRGVVDELGQEMAELAEDRFLFEQTKPDETVIERFGFQPMTTDLRGDQTFYFYLTLAQGETVYQLPLADLKKETLKKNLEAGLKRFATGFTETVALVTPQTSRNEAGFNQLQAGLEENLKVVTTDLAQGEVPGEADILVVLAPKELDDKQVFAIDQFLMKGGTVVLATSPKSVRLGGRQLQADQVESGLTDWLKHHGLTLTDEMVLDPRSNALPVPVTRMVNGFPLRELRLLEYPFFVDVREDAVAEHPITADFRQATLTWASPITVDQEKNREREVTSLLKSSSQSWTSSLADVMPRLDATGASLYGPTGESQAHTLAVVASGRFESYFAEKDSPLDEKSYASQLTHSPDSARLVLFSSNDFLRDDVLGLIGTGTNGYETTVVLMTNVLDWALEDEGLLAIRGRGHFNRTLPPMKQETQMFWEYLNYALVLLGLGLVAIIQMAWVRRRHQHYRDLWEVSK